MTHDKLKHGVRSFALLAYVVIGLTCQASDWDWGPLLSKNPLTAAAGDRVEAAGPFFHHESRLETTSWSLSPLISHTQQRTVDAEEWDYLYPLLTYDRFGAEYRTQFLQLFSLAGGSDMDGGEAKRFSIFPFYTHQRSPNPALNYTSVFPFYGHTKERFLREEIEFAMYPLYLRSRKSRYTTFNYLYPFFHIRKGPHVRGFQFWPIFGSETRDLSTGTDSYDEEITESGYKKVFALWPLFIHNDLDLGGIDPTKERGILPLYHTRQSPSRDSYTFLWPFLHYEVDRKKEYRKWGFPWPLIEFARGKNRSSSRIWPVFGHHRTDTVDRRFHLWPLHQSSRRMTDVSVTERRRILFFLYSDTTQTDLQNRDRSQRTDLWPLFTASRDSTGFERFQFPALFEPILPRNKSVERNYSPLWTFWRHESDPVSGRSRQSFLWNLYSKEAKSDRTKVSLLMGLFRYESSADQRIWQIFRLPVMRSEKKD